MCCIFLLWLPPLYLSLYLLHTTEELYTIHTTKGVCVFFAKGTLTLRIIQCWQHLKKKTLLLCLNL